nr:hypothetical protein [Methylobacterium terricola]
MYRLKVASAATVPSDACADNSAVVDLIFDVVERQRAIPLIDELNQIVCLDKRYIKSCLLVAFCLI